MWKMWAEGGALLRKALATFNGMRLYLMSSQFQMKTFDEFQWWFLGGSFHEVSMLLSSSQFCHLKCFNKNKNAKYRFIFFEKKIYWYIIIYILQRGGEVFIKALNSFALLRKKYKH